MLHPLQSNTFVWSDIPDSVKKHAEMKFYNGTELEDAYKAYGVNPVKGAVTVVRPDGYIGTIADVKDTDPVQCYLNYLKDCLREVVSKTNGA